MGSRIKLPVPQRPKHRNRQIEDRVPLKIMRPLGLRDFVSGRSDASSGVVCLQEMSVMLACFKQNEFDQATCAKEIQSFQSCLTDSKKQYEAKLENERRGVLAGEKKLSHQHLNKVLKKYPVT